MTITTFFERNKVRKAVSDLRQHHKMVGIVLSEHDRLREGINGIMELSDRKAIDIDQVADLLANLLWVEEKS